MERRAMLAVLRRLRIAYLFFWARLVVRRRRPFVVGITGSVGKTTTKETVAAVLMHPDARPTVGRVRKTQDNYNAEACFALFLLGYDQFPWSPLAWIVRGGLLPLRALAMAGFGSYPRVLVVEFATKKPGYIAAKASVAPPDVAVVTAVGPAHLAAFGTLERIAREKAALVRAVPPSGLVVLARDDPYVAAMQGETTATVVTVPGRGIEFSRTVARVVGRHLGLSDELVERALREVRAVPGRLDVLDLGDVTVIDDAYNANPLSMRLGLDTLAGRAPGQRRVAILGEMTELGAEAPRYHEEIATYARERADVLVGVGPLARHYRPDHWFATSAACADGLGALVRRGDCLLVKGSHRVHLQTVVHRLERLAREPRPQEGGASGA